MDEHAESLPGETRSKLHQARTKAVAHNPGARYGLWLGAGAVAASLTVAVLVADQEPPPLPDIYADPTQQAAAENLELMDDLEFIAWLVLQEDMANESGNNT